jgi:hypothetical protein
MLVNVTVATSHTEQRMTFEWGDLSKVQKESIIKIRDAFACTRKGVASSNGKIVSCSGEIEVHDLMDKEDNLDSSPDSIITICASHHRDDHILKGFIPPFTRLFVLVRQHGIVQEALAKETGFSQGFISKAIRSPGSIDMWKLTSIQKALNKLTGANYSLEELLS